MNMCTGIGATYYLSVCTVLFVPASHTYKAYTFHLKNLHPVNTVAYKHVTITHVLS